MNSSRRYHEQKKRRKYLAKRFARAGTERGADPLWTRLTNMPETELATSDIAVLNLACADGIPGSEALDLTSCLARLSTWARHLKREIMRNWHRHVRDSQHNGYSIAQWQIAMMITVLQQDCGVRYNPNRIYSPDFTDSRDQFSFTV